MKNKRSYFRNKFHIIYVIFWVISLSIFLFVSCKTQTEQDNNNDVFNRVIKTNTIKCGYVIYPPGSIKDPNTGKLSGIFIETLEKAAKNLGLKVVWTEEVGWGNMIEGLLNDRYDLIGSPVWANSSRAKHADFTVPLFYSGIGIIVRENDNRFNNDFEKINDPNVKIATIDGEMSSIIANDDFPEAQKLSLPQLSDVSQLMLNVTNKKADVTFVEPFYANEFLRKNPNTIKNIAEGNPIRIFPNTMMLKKGETKFKTMLNTALQELINSGFVDRLIDKYQTYPNEFYRVAKPYRINKK